MKIERLPSGSYRVRKTIKGKTHTLTYDTKPNKAQVDADIAKLYTKPSENIKITFEEAAKVYIDSKRNVLSPRTVKEYVETPKRLSEGFISMPLDKITQLDIQTEINALSKDKKPKTVRNYHAFISAVLRTYFPDMIINTTLPQKVKNEPYIPSEKDVKKVLEYTKKNRPIYYPCFVLATYGLRRSEITAITSDDIEGTILHVNKAKVLDENKNWVIKTTKTTESTRDIIIPQDIANIIKEKGCAFNGYPNDIDKALKSICKALKIREFSLHKFRHFFATKLLSENVDITTVMSLGGWQSPTVLQKHYAHALEEKKKTALDIISKSIG